MMLTRHRHDIDTASEEPTWLDVADMVCVGADMSCDMSACLLFFWGRKIPNMMPTLPTKAFDGGIVIIFLHDALQLYNTSLLECGTSSNSSGSSDTTLR
jgi:hypothetical protein